MHDSITASTWKKMFLIMFLSASILLTVSYYDHAKILKYQVLLSRNISKTNVSEINKTESPSTIRPTETVQVPVAEKEETYLVSSSRCKIIDLDPFSEDAKKFFKPLKYKTCTKKDLLTYVTKQDNIATVHINQKVIPQYTENPLDCCYSNVSRASPDANPDDFIKISPCKEFEHNITIYKEAVMIKCSEGDTKLYENVHTSVRITENVQNKIRKLDNNTNKPISVLFVGIDSISRTNFIRALPKTYKYVEENGWLSLNGYNKIDDNTFPNLMAILTGFNQTTAYKICNPRASGFLDKCPMLWYTFRDLGYITGYAEDAASISTFNYIKKGFNKPPTDYYFRPYVMATENLEKISVSSMAYCTGPETSGERILNLVKDFAVTFKEHPTFGFFWMNTFSHNEISTPTMMDDKLANFLTDLDNSGITDHSLVIFLSDHGIRFGDIRATETGWLEERLPFIYISFPAWFKERFPTEYGNFGGNKNKLTTPYDLHMTLQHILVMSGLNHTVKASDACPECLSLFDEVPEERSCEDAKISQHWCTCAGYSETKLNRKVEKRVAKVFLKAINHIVYQSFHLGGDRCAKYTTKNITVRLSEKFFYKNSSNALVILKTQPKASFETTISFTGDIMNSTLKVGDISRLDFYGTHSYCVADANLKKYCYCK